MPTLNPCASSPERRTARRRNRSTPAAALRKMTRRRPARRSTAPPAASRRMRAPTASGNRCGSQGPQANTYASASNACAGCRAAQRSRRALFIERRARAPSGNCTRPVASAASHERLHRRARANDAGAAVRRRDPPRPRGQRSADNGRARPHGSSHSTAHARDRSASHDVARTYGLPASPRNSAPVRGQQRLARCISEPLPVRQRFQRPPRVDLVAAVSGTNHARMIGGTRATVRRTVGVDQRDACAAHRRGTSRTTRRRHRRRRQTTFIGRFSYRFRRFGFTQHRWRSASALISYQSRS